VSVAKQSPQKIAQDSREPREFSRRLERVLTDEAERLDFWNCVGSDLKKSQRVLRWNPLKKPLSSEIEDLRVELFADERPESPDWNPEAWFVGPEQVRILDSHPLMGAGLLFVQEAGASEVVAALDVQAGQRVLDMCAAPGAKSTQIAEALGGSGWLVANEPDTRRAKKLDALLARHGAENVTVYAAAGERLPELLGVSFDRILIDAPCSGESLFFKRSEKRDDVRDSEVRRCAQIQDKLLAAAAELASESARLIYSTCTYSRDENEDRIEKFLSEHSEWTLVRQQRRWPHRDGMAGGYWALIQKGSARAASAERVQSSDFDAKHVVRHGLVGWSGELDSYAQAMSASEQAQSRPIFEIEDLSRLKAYLRGEALVLPTDTRPSEECAVFWKGRCVGVGKRVPGRLNNLLPKTLKSS
jgi:16S rRNA C967 or C1407 C5-methylase (RsmB/RsmF family)